MLRKQKSQFNTGHMVGYKTAERTTSKSRSIIAVILAFLYVTVTIVAFSGAQPAQAAIPKYINFQGKLTAVSGGTNVANGTYAIQFKLYDALTSGSLLWTETYDQSPVNVCQKIQVTNGVFNAKLGSCNSLSSVDFTGGSLYLTVNFAPTGTSYDGEMAPRKQLVSSAFAFVANGVSGDGVVNSTVSSATALAIAKSGSNYALQVDTSTGSAATGLKVTSAAAAGGVALAAISSGTDENLTLNAKGAGTISINGTATGDVLLGGGSASTGCTVTNSTGAFACQAGGTFTTVNATTALQYNGTDINTAGTLTNVAYRNQVNTFTANNIFQPTVTTGTGATAGVQVAANSLTTGQGVSISSSSLSSGSLVDLAVTGTAGASSQKVINVATTGAITGTQTTYGGYFANTHSGGTSTNVGLYATATGGTNNYAAIFNAGNVGIGDASPNSLLTVGSGDLFQINTTGQIGSQQAPVSDYLFALAGTTGNDHSRIIDITQADDAVESSAVINIASTISPGNITTGGMTFSNINSTLTPTINFRATSSTQSTDTIGMAQGLSLANITIDASTGRNLGNFYTSQNSITVSPNINDTDATGLPNAIAAYGQNIIVSGSPTLTDLTSEAAIINSAGINISANASSAGDANLSYNSYGILSSVAGDLTTTGNTTHYGGSFTVAGTADLNYGLFVDASAATTNNYGIYIANPSVASTNYALYSAATAQSVFAGSLVVGGSTSATETMSNAGYVYGGDDLFVAGMAGVEGNIYTDGSFVAGASTTISNGSISQSSGETLTIGTTAAGLTLQTTTSGTLAVTSAAALNLTSGGSSDLTLDSASGRVKIATADFLNTAVSGVSGAVAGDIWYDSAAGKFKINETTGGTKILCNTTDAGCGAGGSTAWDVIVDPSGNGAIAMGATVQTLDWGSITSTTGLAITGGSAMTSGTLFKVGSATFTHDAAQTGNLASLLFSDTTSSAFTTITNGLLISPTINTTAANSRTFNGVAISPTLTACGTTAGTCLYNSYQTDLPALTQTTTNGFTLNGFNLASAGALVQNTAAGTITWNGSAIVMPNITGTLGTITASGLKVTTGTITTGGTQNGLSVVAQGVSAGTLNGISIGGITADTGTETGLKIAAGWDDAINVAGGNITQGSAVTPVIKGNISDATNLSTPYGVYVSGKYAYVTAYSTDRLTIVDISNPASPTVVGSVTDGTNLNGAYGVAVSGKYAYVTSNISDSLTVVDISNPASPTVAGSISDSTNLDSPYTGVYVSGKYAYVAAYTASGNLTIVDISNPASPTLTSSLSDATNLAGSYGVYVSGKYAYVTSSSTNRLTVVNISNPASPTVTGSIQDNSNLNVPKGVYVSGKYAYVVSSTGSNLAVVNISNPASPTVVGSIADGTNLATPYSVYVSGKYAYVAASGNNRLTTVDISNPASPTVAGSLSNTTNFSGTRGVYVSGKYAYVTAGGGSRLTVVDISGIDSPAANIGNLAAGDITVTENVDIGNNLYVRNGLNVGPGGLMVDGVLTVTSCTGCGGSQTPWTSAVDADAFALQDALNLEFRTAAGSAPAGSVIALYADNSGDLSANVLTGKTYNVQVNGTDEYNFSSTALAMNSNNITGLGTALTATAGLTVTATSANLALVTATSGNITMAPASTGSVQITSGVTTGLTTSAGLSFVANSLSTGAGINASTTSLSSGSLMNLTVSSTAATGNTQAALTIGLNGANSTATQTTFGASIANAHTGTDSTNIGLQLAASGGTNNYALITTGGNVGIGTSTPLDLLQVGDAVTRGSLSVYGDITTKGLMQLTGLANIKDVFIYDTTADSDGGRWVDWATTEKLSWYTETKDDGPADACNISTDDRCGTSSFPRKAALIVTDTTLYIYDATNNKMWMKFSQNASGYALGVDTNNDPSSVSALNGVIYVGTNGSSSKGLYAFDFTGDRMWNYDDTDRSGADLGIGSRNSAITYNSDNNTNFDLATTGTVADWIKVNDVSVANLRQSTTAISTTTTPNFGTTVVSLATDSGLTVINLSTQKVFQYSDATDNDYNAVFVTQSGKLYGLNEALGQAEMWSNIDNENLASRVNGTPDKVWDEASTPLLSKAAPTIIASAPDALEVVERGSLADGGVTSVAATAGSSDLIYVGTNQGLTEIHNSSTPAMGWSKFYTTTRQTALMPATIRRMLTMDDASGNVTNAAKASIMTAKGTPTYGVQGVRGLAMSFNGTSQYLCSDANSDGACDTDTTDDINTGSFNITAWFKHSTTATGVDTLFARCYTTTPAAATGCIAAAMNASGQMVFTADDDALWSIGAATNNDSTITSTQAFNDNQWHFMVFSKINGNVAPIAMIDGKIMGAGTAFSHTTLSGSQILGIANDCSVGAACATGANFWDGSIDDFTYSACGTAACATDGFSTTALLAEPIAHRLYNDARPLVNKRIITVTDATTFTASTLGDSGEAWIPNEFAGQIVTLTGGVGVGQTRRIVSNTTTVLTVSPDFVTTPTATTDFKIDPEALYGATNSVTSIGVTSESQLGEARMLCAGTNDSADGGGVTCFNHSAGPNIVADVYHSDSNYSDWSGGNYDNIISIDITGRNFYFGTGGQFWAEDQSVTLGQGMDYLSNLIFNLKNQLLTLGMTAIAGSQGMEVGLSGGADLAEYYYSTDTLQSSEVVAVDASGDGDDVVRSSEPYSSGLIGVVTTQPALVLGSKLETGTAIALTGRIPVNFSNENGSVKAGDYLTSASVPGYAMRATSSGPIIGKALADSPKSADMTPCPTTEAVNPDATAKLCGSVMIFVEHGDYPGPSIEQLMAEANFEISDADLTELPDENAVLVDSGDLTVHETKQDKILAFLKQMKESKKDVGVSSQILTDRLSATFEVITPNLIADGLDVLSIGSEGKSIEVLSDLNLIGRPYFNADSGGFAKITTGARFVDISFERDYLEQPTVSAMMTVDQDERLAEETDPAVIEQINALNDAQVEELFGSDLQYLVTRKNVHGFRIILNKPAPKDVTFSWIALAIKLPRLVVSEEVTTPILPPDVAPDPNSLPPAVDGAVAGDTTPGENTGEVPPLDTPLDTPSNGGPPATAEQSPPETPPIETPPASDSSPDPVGLI